MSVSLSAACDVEVGVCFGDGSQPSGGRHLVKSRMARQVARHHSGIMVDVIGEITYLLFSYNANPNMDHRNMRRSAGRYMLRFNQLLQSSRVAHPDHQAGHPHSFTQ